MYFALPKRAVFAFLFTAIVYLVSIRFVHYPLTTLLKSIPLACLIIGILQGQIQRWAKMLIITALGFSMAGDIVLTLPINLSLELGIGFFLLVHWCYIGLLLNSYKCQIIPILFYCPILLASGWFLSVLSPYLGTLIFPVLAYFIVLVIMVFCAFQVAAYQSIIAAGALSFLLSDAILSYNVFISTNLDLRIAIMFTYYLAQLLLVIGLAGIYRVKDRNKKR